MILWVQFIIQRSTFLLPIEKCHYFMFLLVYLGDSPLDCLYDEPYQASLGALELLSQLASMLR